jgi:VWFA-related protein
MTRAVVLAAAALVAGQLGTFRSTTDVVLVEVLVTDRGRPVDGLSVNDFQLRDSGVRQSISLIAVDRVPIDLRLSLDVSSSLAGTQLETLKHAARAAIAALRPGDRGEILTFADTVTRRLAWTADRARLNAEVDQVSGDGWTSLIDATFTSLALPTDATRRTLVLVFTDGRDTASWLSAADVVRSAAQSTATLYGVTSAPVAVIDREATDRLRTRLLNSAPAYSPAFLQVVAAETGGETMYTTTPADLRTAFVQVMSRFNQRYLLSYTPAGVASGGWHPIEVRVGDPALTVTARRGYVRSMN